ncbi:MAG: hypothetical protein U9R06_00920, partial [Patescibacteria group bacterium]|nr:hypothetical protein [Patescibacteria group bacterium]
KINANNAENRATIDELISEKIVYDEEINRVGLERIKKIKKLIDEKRDFIQTANKLGDEQGQLTISPENEKNYVFSEQLKELNISEISDIIVAKEGYYIFKLYEKSMNLSGLSYVFVKAKNLSEYAEEAAFELKIWSLIK